MNTSIVGASILNIITESLYDKPLVVFREYVQNSADSLSSIKTNNNKDCLYNYIWAADNNLLFLDNGAGISPDEFLSKMESIAFSNKDKYANIGYKGIGRLSGISYCKRLRFINIVDYNNKKFQEYYIDCIKYNDIQKTEDFNELSFSDLMKSIGTFEENVNVDTIISLISPYSNIFTSRNTGFLVILEDISNVLSRVIKDERFCEDLSWLLPLPFKDDLFDESNDTSALFDWLSNRPVFENTNVIAAQAYQIFFNNKQLFRPLKKNMFRTYLCKSRFENYAVCVTSFSNEKIEIDRKNPFSGIRVYIDNMLLCDENELIPILQQYGLTNHGLYELIQSVRGVGALIYIVDKINISANARRTFIELTDPDALALIELISAFVNNIYDTRYALSRYATALKKEETAEDSLIEKRDKALKHLELLAKDEVQVEVQAIEKGKQKEFNELTITEQKRVVKGKLSKKTNDLIKQYLSQTDTYNIDTCYEDFKVWLLAN